MVLAAVLFFGLVSCRAELPPAEIPVGVILTLSGPMSEWFGEPSRQGFLLAEKAAENLPALIKDGRPYKIKLYFEDDKLLPEEGVFTARKLINQKGVQVLLGAPSSATAVPISLVAETRRVPLIATTASHPSLTFGKGYVFQINTTLKGKSSYLATELTGRKGFKTAAALYDVTNSFSRASAVAFKNEWLRLGGTWLGEVTYIQGDPAGKVPLEQVLAGSPQVVFLPSYPTDLEGQINGLHRLKPGQVLVGLDNFASLEPSNVEGPFWFVSTKLPLPDQPDVNQFYRRYEDAFGSSPNMASVMAYDAYFLLREALTKTQDWDSAGLATALRSVNHFEGVMGPVSYNGNGSPDRELVLYTLKTVNGRKQIHPESMRESDR